MSKEKNTAVNDESEAHLTNRELAEKLFGKKLAREIRREVREVEGEEPEDESDDED